MPERPSHTSPKKSGDDALLKSAVLGVGAAGNSVLERLALERAWDVHLLSLQTDARLLARSMAGEKLNLGTQLLHGVGAGGDPELGREAALQSLAEIDRALEGFDLVLLCGGLGGGTAGGAMPVIARQARKSAALVVVVACMPFSFEGLRRQQQAREALEQLEEHADAIILFDNDRMAELVLPKDGIHKAFSQADALMSQCLRSVAGLLGTQGLVKLGIDDIIAALRCAQHGRCLFALGEARGQNRGSDAVKRALKSPLMDQGRLLHQTRNLLVHVCGGESLTLAEVDAIMKLVARHVPDDTRTSVGVTVQPAMGDAVTVMMLSALGLEQFQRHSAPQPQVQAAVVNQDDAAQASEADEAAATSKRSNKMQTPPPPRPDPLDELMGNLFTQSFGPESAPQQQASAPQPAAASPEPTLLDLLANQIEQTQAPEQVLPREETQAAEAPPAETALEQQQEAPAIRPRRPTLEEFLGTAQVDSPQLPRTQPIQETAVASAAPEPTAEMPPQPRAAPEPAATTVAMAVEPAPAEVEDEGMQLPSWLRNARLLGRR